MNYFNCRQPLETKSEKGMITVKNEEIELLKELKNELIKTRRMIFFIHCQNYYDKYGIYPDALYEVDPEELKKVGINLDTDKDIYNYQKESRK